MMLMMMCSMPQISLSLSSCVFVCFKKKGVAFQKNERSKRSKISLLKMRKKVSKISLGHFCIVYPKKSFVVVVVPSPSSCQTTTTTTTTTLIITR